MLYKLHICPNNPEKYHFQWLPYGYSLVIRGYSFVLKQFLYGWKMRLNSCVASQMPILTSLYRVNTNKFHLQNLDNCPPVIVQFTSFFSQNPGQNILVPLPLLQCCFSKQNHALERTKYMSQH